MNCQHCTREFMPCKPWQVYCSKSCREQSRAQHGAEADGVDGPVMTQAEVGAALGVSQSTADNIEKAALRKLRGQMRREDWL